MSEIFGIIMWKLVEKLAIPLLSMAVTLVYRALLFGSRKYPHHPYIRGGGRSICLIFQWQEGCTIGKYSPRILVMHKRVTKTKHKNLP